MSCIKSIISLMYMVVEFLVLAIIFKKNGFLTFSNNKKIFSPALGIYNFVT